MEKLKRNNHYVSKFYLDNWANGKNVLWRYNLLVPHENVRLWKDYPPNVLARQRDLYTRVQSDFDNDDIEQWFDKNFEDLSAESISKAIAGKALTYEDWSNIINYLAMQDVRTPARLTEHLERLHQSLPSIMENVLGKLEGKLRQRELIEPRKRTNREYGLVDLPMKVLKTPHENPDLINIGVEVTPGRGTWLHSINHLLEKTSKVLHTHKWTVMRPAEGVTWPTSDNPVIKLNYYSEGNYDFKGGWGSSGTEILFPISPQHIIYTKIGEKPPTKGNRFNFKTSLLIRKFIIEAAHRMIISSEIEDDVLKIRPRVVNAQMYAEEQEQWRDWHNAQSKVERYYENKG
ncbi:DUF4238 domain-containing protein [Kiloniella majae]|uniref:DUF4238 domain-containing protein n=1 Tax=Kiloniella majae TaxID=1938558 RepID=UPI0013027CEB|nr:DUF4238 domain-containing protein [Kiloniella majae]